MARAREFSEKYYEAGDTYLNLVKSRIMGALVTEDEKLLPEGAAREHDFSLLLALCAYFAARTDHELERRGMEEDARTDVWIGVIEYVFQEMEISREVETVARDFILRQMEVVGSVLEEYGPSDHASVVFTLEALSNMAEEVAGVSSDGKVKIQTHRVKEFMEKYEEYCPYLDDLVANS